MDNCGYNERMSNIIQENVKEFMQKAGQETPNHTVTPTDEDRMLRVSLLLEEVLELAEASGVCIHPTNEDGTILYNNLTKDQFSFGITNSEVDMVEVADAVADINYVSYGCAITYGIDMEPIDAEVHRSNMSKFIDGHRRDDGKWVKGKSYSSPNIKALIEAQTI